MEEPNVTTEETIVATQQEETSEPQAEITPTSPQDQLNALINRRMGEFDVRITYSDLKYLKNTLNQKVEWKGPNEAYLVIISILTLENCLQSIDPKQVEPVQTKLPAATIEAINFFLSRISGVGHPAAQKLFSISMILRPAMETIKKIGSEIEKLQSEIKN